MRSSATDPSRATHDARRLVADLFAPRPAIYWSDLLGSLAVAVGGTAVATTSSGGLAVVGGTVAALALHRAVAFRREIVHLRRGELTAFTTAWNALVGIPLGIPSWTATRPGDTPARGPVRLGLIVPVILVTTLAGLALVAGRLPQAASGTRWCVPLLLVGLAAAGLEAARRAVIRLHEDRAVTIESPLAEAALPVGGRYEALHRLIPALPYHNLGAAHRRILAALPDWHDYRRAVRRSLLDRQPATARPAAAVRRAG